MSSSSFQTGTYNTLTFIQAGLDAIDKGGTTKLSVRSNHQSEDSHPAWQSWKGSGGSARCYGAGSSQRLKLNVTYSEGWTVKIGPVTDPAKVGRIPVSEIQKISRME